MKHIIYLCSFAMLFITSTVLAEAWNQVSNQQTLGISGIAAIDTEHFLVVHDNKKPDQPRLGIINWQNNQKPTLTPLTWCDQNLPIDLEAITAIPNYSNAYLVLESKGSVTRIQLGTNNSFCKTLGQFPLPKTTPESNMEGLALYCAKKKSCVLMWAERGDDKTPAKFSWSSFDKEKNKIDEFKVDSFNFKAVYPETNLRSISDIMVDNKGSVWVSAASDAGDDGPFKSALYKIGSFSKKYKWMPAKQPTPDTKYDTENIKIEAISFTARGLILATDDENKGGKIAIKPIK